MTHLSACPHKSLDRAIYLYILHENVRLSGVTASIISAQSTIHKNIVRSRFFCRIAKKSIERMDKGNK